MSVVYFYMHELCPLIVACKSSRNRFDDVQAEHILDWRQCQGQRADAPHDQQARQNGTGSAQTHQVRSLRAMYIVGECCVVLVMHICKNHDV